MVIFNCIANGLFWIHSIGLIHRDFHPENILVGNHQSGIYSYIADLGLCRWENGRDRGKYYGLTQYLPPEYFKHGQYKKPADVYAFGIISYFLFIGKFPFREDWDGWKKVKGKVLNNGWLKFKENDINLPPLLMKLIKRCCDNDPLKRPTAEYLATISEDWAKAIGVYGEQFVNKDSEFYKQHEEMKRREV